MEKSNKNIYNERYRKKSGVVEYKFKFRLYPTEGDLKARLQAARAAEGVAPYVKRLIREDLIRCEAQSLPGWMRHQNGSIEFGGDSQKCIVGNVTHDSYIRLCSLIGKEKTDYYVERAREFLNKRPHAGISASNILKWYSEDSGKDDEWFNYTNKILYIDSEKERR